MRLLRIRLRNFRGVDASEIEFLRDGVTVVVGPNEVGKSSLAEGLDLLFNQLDSTTRSEVKAVKPVDRDAGPEVEADVETGPYAFTYRKRFLKGSETVLRITRPRPESLTGREAHQRVQQILGETMDTALWKALWIKQGEGLGQASLKDAASLGRALDQAAGTVPEGPAETTLFDRAKAEYDLYWTPTGKPRGDGPLRDAVEQQQAVVSDLDRQLREIAGLVERDADLTAERAGLAERQGPEEASSAAHEARWRRIESLARDVERLEASERAAGLEAERAAEASRTRGAAVADLARAEVDRATQHAAIEAAAPTLDAARERNRAAAGAFREARASREQAEARARTARADAEFLRARASLEDLSKRRRALDAARASLAEAEAAVATNLVDDAALSAIRAADREAVVARSLLDAGRPSVDLTARREIGVIRDGATVQLRAGEAARWPVAERVVVELPDVLRIEVQAGTGDAAIAERAAEAERALRAACAAAGAVDLAAAELAGEARRTALATSTEQRRHIVELLGGEAPGLSDALDAQIAAAQRRTAGYLEARPPDPPMPVDVDSAAADAAAAEAAADAARTSETALEQEDRAAREQLAERELAAREAAVLLELLERDAAARSVALSEARAAAPDAVLAGALAGAAAGREAAVAATAAAREALALEDPETARTLRDNARLVLAETAGRLRTLEISQAEVRARLRDHGEDGLAERRDQALAARDAAASELARWTQRAEARRRLYEALRTARDAAHRAKVSPLRDRITTLGRVVFGQSLIVEVSDDLAVHSRTLDGRTVPFESLSVGAREQFGVLTRLACAMIVAEDGGVPVMLDDALGFSDPRRLEAMGAVLSLASAACQVIVLTCYPERYRHVGGAKTVSLPQEVGATSRQALP